MFEIRIVLVLVASKLMSLLLSDCIRNFLQNQYNCRLRGWKLKFSWISLLLQCNLMFETNNRFKNCSFWWLFFVATLRGSCLAHLLAPAVLSTQLQLKADTEWFVSFFIFIFGFFTAYSSCFTCIIIPSKNLLFLFVDRVRWFSAVST